MSVQNFIAHFLKENGYSETLKSFEKEYGSPISTELPHDEALADIITDRMKFLSTKPNEESHDKWLDKELLQIKNSQFKDWSAPYPEKSQVLASMNELVIDGAVIDSNGNSFFIGGTSGRNLIVLNTENGNKVLELQDIIGKVVIRRIVVSSEYVLLCGMNGKVYMGKFSTDMTEFTLIAEQQIHARLITDVKVVRWNDDDYLVSVGWDFLVKVFKISPDGLSVRGEPYKLANQGTCLDACVYEDSIYITVGKSEITLMDVLRFDGSDLKLDCRIALNDAEFSASGFTPMCICIFLEGAIPLVAVGTSHEPYMRVVIVSLKDVGTDSDIKRNQIIANINTMSPQDKYSQARIAWRYDGSGIWIMGEDGIVRGLDICKERVIVELKEHDGRIKSSVVHKDVVITCGTDRRVLKWVY